MENIKKDLENWLNELNHFSFKDYEELPDIELYMDQVVTFLEKQLRIFQTYSDDKQITPSMINNYVKGEVIPAPITKKYNREHLASLEEVVALKQVLTLAEVKQVVETLKTSEDKASSFNDFKKASNEKFDLVINEAFKGLNDIDDNDSRALTNLALDFALSANAYITVAKRILFLNKVFETLNNNKKEEKKESAE